MEFITGTFNWISTNYLVVLEFIGAFAIAAQFTPNKNDDKVVQFILDTVNVVGQNNGQAKNA
jgi:hypothetical protein